jgi:uncharacterized membrane protein YdjX (TVP38/TMEM64 family)
MGALYGILPGALLMCAACTVGSVVNFLLGRFVIAGWARKKISESDMLTALEAVLQERAVSIIILARLSPVFPFALVRCAPFANVFWSLQFSTRVLSPVLALPPPPISF